MGKQIANKVDPFKLAERGVTESGTLELAELDRLAENIDPSSEGTVDYSMRFFTEGRHRRAEGHVKTTVNLICQRCLTPMPVDITGQFGIEFVREEPAETENDEENVYEWVMIPEEPIALSDLIEDEVMLALPFAPMHEEGDCTASSTVKELQENSRLNPFAVLEGLKSKKQES